MRPKTSCGFRPRQTSGPRPRRSITPGRMPSIRASAVAIRSSATARSSESFRSRAIERLPLFRMPTGKVDPGSEPLVFRSMRTTSAPRSARCMPQKGAGPMPSISTIRMPCRGPLDTGRHLNAETPVRLRPIRSFWISVVPSGMGAIIASRARRSTMNSFVTPLPP